MEIITLPIVTTRAGDDDYDPFSDDCETGEFDDFDCGLGEDGQCANAGSEWCDFECPMRDSDAYAGNR